MDENKSLSPIDTTSLDANSKNIAQQILDSTSVEEVQDLTELFNLNTKKKNVVRVLKMNDLLDKVTDQVLDRFNKRPDNFSNEDLIKFMQVTENSLDRASKHVSDIEDLNTITLQQNNQVNINVAGELNRDSRAKVADAVSAILKKLQNSQEPIIIDEETSD